jgi:phosphoribosylamine--glycine ligase
VVLEKRLYGPECSVLALTDGVHIAVLPPAQDHKRAYDGDQGPNTGGMGAFAPSPLVKDGMLERIKAEILQPAVDGLRSEGRPFIGCLFAGLMMTESGPKVIEFNCRFGDPETQAILPLLDCDLLPVIQSCVRGCLSDSAIRVRPNTSAVSVVLASGGYPGNYSSGHVISGLDRARCVPGVSLFHAGTKALIQEAGNVSCTTPSGNALRRLSSKRFSPNPNAKPSVVTSGGRVLAVTAIGVGVV